MTNSPPTPQIRPGLVLALVSLPVFIGALDLTIVSAVLPAVMNDLGIPLNTGGNEAAWIISGYLLAYTVSMLFFGRISDLIGRRRTYMIALLIFILGSWLVAISRTGMLAQLSYTLTRILSEGRPDRAFTTLNAMIFARVVQALGAGAMVPTSLALVADLYPPEKRATPLGIIGGVDTAGWVLGHLYGGVMVQWVDWPILFWLNVPITTLAAFLTWRMLRPVAEKSGEGGGLGRLALVPMLATLAVLNVEGAVEIVLAFFREAESLHRVGATVLNVVSSRPVSIATALALLGAIGLVVRGARRLEGAGRPDWLGILLVTGSLLGLNLGLSAGGEISTGASFEGLAPPPSYAIPMLIGAAVLLAVFVWSQRRSAYPLLNMANFRKRNLALASGINLLVGFCLMVGLVSVPLFINSLVFPPPDLSRAALVSGYLLGGLTIPMALAAVPGGWLTDRVGYRIPTVIGLALALVGFYLASSWQWDPPTRQAIMASHLIVAGVGLGLSETPIAAALINAVQATERGMAAALVLIMRLVGMTIGTSAMTTYGLRRWSGLNQRALAQGATNLGIMANDNLRQTINEMLIVAAGVCLLALLPALFMRARDAATGAR